MVVATVISLCTTVLAGRSPSDRIWNVTVRCARLGTTAGQEQFSVPPAVRGVAAAPPPSVQVPPSDTVGVPISTALVGSVSTMVTACADEGPSLRTVARKVSGAPAEAVRGDTCFSATRSTSAVAAMPTVLELLPSLLSLMSLERAVAVLL